MFIQRSYRDDFYDTIKEKGLYRVRTYHGYDTKEDDDPSYIMEFRPNGVVTIATFSNRELKLAIYKDLLEKYGLKKDLWKRGYENFSDDEEWDKFRNGELTEAFKVLKQALYDACEHINQDK